WCRTGQRRRVHGVSPDRFPAVVIDRDASGQQAAFKQIDVDMLPPGNVLVRVEASTVNYKDGLLVSGAIPLIESFPMVPGIDLAGVVEWSDHPVWRPGDTVVAN